MNIEDRQDNIVRIPWASASDERVGRRLGVNNSDRPGISAMSGSKALAPADKISGGRGIC